MNKRYKIISDGIKTTPIYRENWVKPIDSLSKKYAKLCTCGTITVEELTYKGGYVYSFSVLVDSNGGTEIMYPTKSK